MSSILSVLRFELSKRVIVNTSRVHPRHSHWEEITQMVVATNVFKIGPLTINVYKWCSKLVSHLPVFEYSGLYNPLIEISCEIFVFN